MSPDRQPAGADHVSQRRRPASKAASVRPVRPPAAAKSSATTTEDAVPKAASARTVTAALPVQTARSGGVFTVTMHRPPGNALDDALVDALDAAIEAASAASDVAVLHLRSACKVFCAGADLALMQDSIRTPVGLENMLALVRRLQRLAARLEALPLVTVAETIPGFGRLRIENSSPPVREVFEILGLTELF